MTSLNDYRIARVSTLILGMCLVSTSTSLDVHVYLIPAESSLFLIYTESLFYLCHLALPRPFFPPFIFAT